MIYTANTSPMDLPPAPDLSLERLLWEAGIESIAGIDEVGRGALAGPVVAAALILPNDPAIAQSLQGVNDSKKMTPLARIGWSRRLPEIALAWGVGSSSNTEIDAIGILPATRLAAQRALGAMRISPQHLLLDYLFLPDCGLPQTALVKGDARSLSIAAASIIAKTVRDDLMRVADLQFPGFDFARHKGYCTRDHVIALAHRGPCPIHRLTFAPIRSEAGR